MDSQTQNQGYQSQMDGQTQNQGYQNQMDGQTQNQGYQGQSDSQVQTQEMQGQMQTRELQVPQPSGQKSAPPEPKKTAGFIRRRWRKQ